MALTPFQLYAARVWLLNVDSLPPAALGEAAASGWAALSPAARALYDALAADAAAALEEAATIDRLSAALRAVRNGAVHMRVVPPAPTAAVEKGDAAAATATPPAADAPAYDDGVR